MVLGIVGLVLSFVPCLGMYAAPLTLTGVILGAIAMKKSDKGKGMAIAGLVTGIIGTVIAGYWIYVWITFKGEADSQLRKFEQEMKDEMKKEMDKELKKELSK